jgi:hypothetical protein
MNPPFGGRHGHVPWLTKFFDHGDGVAVVRSYTSSDWWHDHMHRAHALLWPRGKTKFIPSPELRAKLEAKAKNGKFHNAPGHGIVLVGMGSIACAALGTSGLGMFWDRRLSTRQEGDADPAAHCDRRPLPEDYGLPPSWGACVTSDNQERKARKSI